MTGSIDAVLSRQAHWIDGDWRVPRSDARFWVRDPATEEVIGSVPGASAEDVGDAVEAAARAAGVAVDAARGAVGSPGRAL
jgi:acyl-CoA reductase-like NAD-dependent aldehyde dehydrogenase